MRTFHFTSILLFSILLLQGCKKEETTPILPTNPFCTIVEDISSIKNHLLTKQEENILITKIDTTNNQYQLSYEDSSVLKFNIDFLSNYEVVDTDWMVFFSFDDSTELNIDFLGSTFSIHQDSIVWNSSGISPLSAKASINTPVKGSIFVEVLGKNSTGIAINHQFSHFGKKHNFPILGLYPNYQNEVVITFTNKDGLARISDTIAIQTPDLNAYFPIEIVQNNYNLEGQNKLFHLSAQSIIFDTQGEIRWWLNRDLVRTYPTTDGNMICALTVDRQAWDGEAIYYNMEGEVLNEYSISTGIHHEFIQKEAGGNFLVGSSVGGVLTQNSFDDDDTEDLIVEIDKESGAIIKEWNLREYFDENRPRFWTERPNDWCHLNSIQYDPSDNTLLISSKLQSFIAKIGYDDGAIRWILGNPIHWKAAWQPYLLQPINFDMTFDENQDWTYAQHSARLTPEGHIIIYDNGPDRPGFDADSTFNKNGGYLRSVEYKVNENDMTVEKIWDHAFYGKNVYSTAVGSVERLPNGNTLEGHGLVSNNQPKVIEVNQNKDIVFEANVPNLFYRVYLVDLYKGYE